MLRLDLVRESLIMPALDFFLRNLFAFVHRFHALENAMAEFRFTLLLQFCQKRRQFKPFLKG